MSAHPAVAVDGIPGQDETHARIQELLGAVTDALLDQQPVLRAFHDHRPQRDRSSGSSWRGLQTLCHVSALLASAGRPAESAESTTRLLETAGTLAAARGMRGRDLREGPGFQAATWHDDAGELLEVIVGVRVAVRAISAPFLPGSLRPMPSTSPPPRLSPLSSPRPPR